MLPAASRSVIVVAIAPLTAVAVTSLVNVYEATAPVVVKSNVTVSSTAPPATRIEPMYRPAVLTEIANFAVEPAAPAATVIVEPELVPRDAVPAVPALSVKTGASPIVVSAVMRNLADEVGAVVSVTTAVSVPA
jgi:hypothetical protein